MRTQLTEELLVELVPPSDISSEGKEGARRGGAGGQQIGMYVRRQLSGVH